MWLARFAVIAVLLLTATGCQIKKSAFANQAGEVRAEFAAAATTLQYLHDGKVTTAFAKATFINYATAVQGADQKLASASGAPDGATMTHLLQLYATANDAIASPCLDSTCNWRQQVDALHQASDAFQQAAGGA